MAKEHKYVIDEATGEPAKDPVTGKKVKVKKQEKEEKKKEKEAEKV